MSTRSRSPDDFEREIASHLEHEADELVAAGLPRKEARYLARKRFGNVTHAQERFFEAHRFRWLDETLQDLTTAFRSLRRYPIAALVATLSLAFGIGAATSTLTIRDVIFRKPPPLYRQPEQLSIIRVAPAHADMTFPYTASTTAEVFRQWRESAPLGIEFAASTPSRPVDVRVNDRNATVRIRAVTANLFTLLGVAPQAGALLSTPGESTDAARRSVVLSDRLWQRLFDGRSDAIGASIWIDNTAFTVIGVLPQAFWFTEMTSSIWTLLDPQRLSGDASVQVIARRPPGVSERAAAAALQPVVGEYARHVASPERDLHLRLWPVEGTPMGYSMSTLLPYVLAVSVLLTLVIACANVALLMIAQWTTREHETAIRASLGASRGRLVRCLITESFVLALAGGILGIAATFALRGVILHRAAIDVRGYDLAIEPLVLIEVGLVTVVCALATGLAPALYETRRLHANPLTRIASSDRVRQRWRHALVIVEIAVTVALIVEIGTMISSYYRQVGAQLGFASRPLITLRVENPSGVAVARALEAVTATPTVAAAAASTVVPLATAFGPLETVGVDAAASKNVVAERVSITPSFFQTLDVRVRSGRVFTERDALADRTLIVNQALAEHLFSSQPAVGRSVWIDGLMYEVIGIVANYSNIHFRNRSTR